MGRALAFEHAQRGGDLILVARNEMKLASLVADLQHQCPASRVATVTADFAKGHTAAQVYQEVQGFDWPVDYLINNAGFGGQGKFIDRSLAADQRRGAAGIDEAVLTGDGQARPGAGLKRLVISGLFPGARTGRVLCDQGLLDLTPCGKKCGPRGSR